MPAAAFHRPACLVPAVLLFTCLLVPVSLEGWQQEPEANAGSGASPSTLPSARSPVRGLADPRQLLNLYGIDESHLRFLIDGEDLLPEEVDVIGKILMRFDDLGHDNILRWLSPSMPWEELASDAEKHRLGFFRVEGIARRVERQKIVPEAAVLYGFDHFFWIFLDMPGGQKVRVASRRIPSSWPLEVPLSEPAAARAMYLKHGLEEDGGEFFLFSASRIEWYPEVPSSSRGVSDGLVTLAGMGMDVSLFDDVRSRNRRSLGSQERDCFYRLLELLGGETRPAQAIQPGPVELTELLRSPQQHHGDYLNVKGTVRRITRIEIPDKDVQLRFGMRHYYQMDLFMPLGDQTIQIKLNPDDEQGLKFTNQFPLVVCVRGLPPQLASAQRQLEEGTYAGNMLNETIRMRGFFFKIWGYQSSFSSTDDTPRRQLSPMILAFEPEVVDLETGSGASFSTLPSARSPVRGLADPRQLLNLYGIDESHLRFLIDGEDLIPEEVDVIGKILMRFDDLGHDNILRWLSPSMPWEELASDAEKHRLGFFRVEGIARRVERQKIVPEAAVLYGFDHFFWIFLDMPGGQKVRVASRRIPSSWPLEVPLSEPAVARAMYLKHGLQEDGGEFFLFSASRIEWYPEVPSSSRGVSDGLVALAGMGMDVSLFDDVRTRNRRSLGVQERTCFFRLLELLGGETRPARSIQPRPVALTELLRSPQQHHGDYLDVKGTVRRITRIEIPDKDVPLRFGIQHYYQMDVFMPLGDQTIQIKLNPDDEQGLKFTNQFPLVVCVRGLPPQLASAQRQLEEGTYAGNMLNETIRMRGFFFKIWGYQSSFSSTDDTPRRQLSPMILAFEPEVVGLETEQDGPVGLLLSVLFAVVLLGIWLFTWRSGRRSGDVLKARRERTPPTSAEQFSEMARQLEQGEDPAEPT